MAAFRPQADPFRDTEVVDARAPRFAQATTGTVALLGAVFGWPLAWALMSANILMGLTLGRQWCLPCLAYFRLIQPRVGEGPLEDSRPPRLANVMGTTFLGVGAAAWWLGSPAAGTVLGAMVAALALLAATAGLCVGCELYRLIARVRGISPRHHGHIDPDDFPGLDGLHHSPLPDASQSGRRPSAPRQHRLAYVEFTHPLCAECRRWEDRLRAAGETLFTVDVRERPELAHKYGIAVVPTVVSVGPDGTVLERLAP